MLGGGAGAAASVGSDKIWGITVFFWMERQKNLGVSKSLICFLFNNITKDYTLPNVAL